MPTSTYTYSSTSASRRRILQLGALFGSPLTLPALLQAEAKQGNTSKKSIIMIHLDGGPSQYETIDPKPGAPLEIRGPFAPISTSVPGIQISELMPRVAARTEKFAFVRSVTDSAGRHDAFQCQSGFDTKALASMGGRPALGCVVNRLWGDATQPVPLFVDMMQGRPLARNSARPGFLGPAYQPFRPDLSKQFQRELEAGMKNELSRRGEEYASSLEINPELTAHRFDARLGLLGEIDSLKRDIDQQGMMDAMDQFQQQAVHILTSGSLAKALDLTTEDPAVRARYTMTESRPGKQFYTSETSDSTQKFLLARRLVEAGVRIVSMSISDFDTHSSNFPRMQNLMPIVDFGLSTLVEDLEERGMLDDTLILAWGEFGRTPRVNDKGGRDHWPKLGPALFAGGGISGGQVIGASDRLGSTVADRPVTYPDVFATLYHHLGLNPHQITIPDHQGRPQYLLDHGERIGELYG